MFPILFRIGPLTIHTYGLILAIAFLSGISLATRQAKVEGEDPQLVFDLCFYLVVAAILGSRLLFVIINYRSYLDNPLQIFMLWKGGLVFYGGLIGAVAVGTWYIKRHQLPLGKITDILAPSIALGQAIGRLGCFSAGCCFGKHADVSWAVTFTHPDCLAPTGTPLHPTQLYSSGVALVIFLLLLLIYRFRRFRGQIFWSYVVLYSVGRFILEQFRADERGIVNLLGQALSTSQFISGLALIAGVTMLIILRKRTRI